MRWIKPITPTTIPCNENRENQNNPGASTHPHTTPSPRGSGANVADSQGWFGGFGNGQAPSIPPLKGRAGYR